MSVHNQRWIYSYLVDNGFRPNAAAGIVGNLIQESGCDPYSNQPGGPGMGIMQWSEGERWQSLLNFAHARGADPHNLKLQADFMLHEMKAYGVYTRMQNMVNIESATRLFMNVMESPDPRYANLSGRIAFAQTIRARAPNMATGAGRDGGGNGGNGGGGGGDGGGGNGGPQDLSKGEYGFAHAFLEAHPEIRKLVDKADNQDWTPERFQAELKETKWYKQLTTAQQQWSVISTEHPGEAKTQLDNYTHDVQRLAASLGVKLSKKELDDLALRGARNQLDSTDLQHLIAHEYQGAVQGGKPGADTGMAATTIDQIRDMAEDYGIKMDQHTLSRMTQQVLSGNVTVDQLVDRIREQAKTMYPQLGNKLDTHTVRDLLDPYTNIAADLTGIPTVQMKTSDPRWLRALGNKKDGPLTADEWATVVRTDKQYGYDRTFNARQEGASLGTALGQMFGALGR